MRKHLIVNRGVNKRMETNLFYSSKFKLSTHFNYFNIKTIFNIRYSNLRDIIRSQT